MTWWRTLPSWVNCHHPYLDRAYVLDLPPYELCKLCGERRELGNRLYWSPVTKPLSETLRYGGGSLASQVTIT